MSVFGSLSEWLPTSEINLRESEAPAEPKLSAPL